MTDVLKIALTGKMRSGKDEVARRLMYEHGFEFPIGFGDMLKFYADKVYCHTVNTEAKQRRMYQVFGQACREYDPDVWIRHVEFSVNKALDKRSTRGIVISDLRQPNEYDWCKRNGFVIVRVTAPDEIRLERAKQAGDIFEADDLAHETESYVDSFEVDYEIVNDGSLDELYAKVDELVAKLKEVD